MPFRILFLFSLFVSLPGIIYSIDTIRCDGSLIQIGDVYSEVLHKCGEPTDLIEYNKYSQIHQRFIISPSSRKRILFDEFTITGDLTDPKVSNPKINPKHFHQKISYDLKKSPGNLSYMKYIVQHRYFQETLNNSTNVSYAEWEVSTTEYQMKKVIYNLGPTRFLRTLIFRNGILWQISTGEYGY